MLASEKRERETFPLSLPLPEFFLCVNETYDFCYCKSINFSTVCALNIRNVTLNNDSKMYKTFILIKNSIIKTVAKPIFQSGFFK